MEEYSRIIAELEARYFSEEDCLDLTAALAELLCEAPNVGTRETD